MIKNNLSIILFLSFFNLLSAQQNKQEENKKSISDKIHFGGGIQLSIGNAYTVIGISPSAIYELNEHFASGISATYLYVNDKFYNSKQNVYGGSVLVLYNPIKELQLNSEFEYLRINRITNLPNTDYWIPALYVGAGYAIGKHGAVGVRYDLLWKENKSVYNDALTPYFRFYF